MKPVETDAGRLKAHMTGTYLNLRIGIGLIGAALPWLLWLGGRIRDGESLRPSMSAYYYSPTQRDVFVGALVAIGVFLYLYKGFSRRENWALNLAGVFAVGVAMVPTSPPDLAGAGWLTWHGTFAVLFFGCIAYVCVFRASDTLSLVRDTGKARRLRLWYRVLGVGMLLSPLIAVVVTVVLGRAGQLVFFLEAVAVLMFAAYWILKSLELRSTDAEVLASQGKLEARVEGTTPASTRPGRLVQIEP